MNMIVLVFRSILSTTAGFTSGQPTCIGVGARDRRQSTERDSIAWSCLLEDKLEGPGRRRRRRQEGLKLSLNSVRASDAKNEDLDISGEVVDRRRRLPGCRGFRQFTEMAVGTLLLGVVLLVTPGINYYI